MFRIKNLRRLLPLVYIAVFLSGCKPLVQLVVTNDKPYAVTVYEKFKNMDDVMVIREVGVVPPKQTKDFGSVLATGDNGKHTLELRNAQDKVIGQATALEDENDHYRVNLHINR